MKNILALIFCFMFAVTSHAATVTVAQTGNWSSTSTWVGGALPQTTDTVALTSDSTLTVDGNYTAASITAYNYGKVIIDTSRKLTITGTSAWGNTAPQMSYLTQRAGSELSIGGTMTIGAIQWITEGTTASTPAKISGAGGVAHVAASKRSNLTFSHFIVANSSTFSIAMGSSTTSLITYEDSGFSMTNCVILPGGKLTMGTSNTSIQNRRLELVNCDVRDRSIDMNGMLSPTVKRVVGNTFSTNPALGVAQALKIVGAQPTEPLVNNVFDNYVLNGSAPLLVDENIFFQTNATSGQSYLVMGGTDGGPAARVHRNYVYTAIDNSHGITGGSIGDNVQNNCTENVFEVGAGSTGGSNMIVTGSAKKFVSRNLMIGKAVNLVGLAGTYLDGKGMIITRNTITGETTGSAGDPFLFLTESGEIGDNYNGTEIIRSNLIAPTILTTGSTSGTLLGGNNDDDTWGTVGHNAVYNLSGTKYIGTILNDETANDVALLTGPGFVEPSRNLSEWASRSEGMSPATPATVAAAFLTVNGYDPAAQKQTGTAFTGTVTNLLEWVRAGFSPTRTALDGTGYGGEDIGAIDVGTGGEVVDPPDPEVVYNKFVSVTLYAAETPLPNLTGLTAIWWDTVPPSGNPVFTTPVASTNANGTLTLNLTDYTTLNATQSGFLFVYEHNATDYRNSRLFGSRLDIWQEPQ